MGRTQRVVSIVDLSYCILWMPACEMHAGILRYPCTLCTHLIFDHCLCVDADEILSLFEGERQFHDRAFRKSACSVDARSYVNRSPSFRMWRTFAAVLVKRGVIVWRQTMRWRPVACTRTCSHRVIICHKQRGSVRHAGAKARSLAPRMRAAWDVEEGRV